MTVVAYASFVSVSNAWLFSCVHGLQIHGLKFLVTENGLTLALPNSRRFLEGRRGDLEVFGPIGHFDCVPHGIFVRAQKDD